MTHASSFKSGTIRWHPLRGGVIEHRYKFISAIAISLTILCGAQSVSAALLDRGSGLIYDDVLHVTWLQDANFAKSSGFSSDGHLINSEADAWTQSLAYFDKARNTIWTGWRLPTVSPINGHSLQKDFAFDGTSEIGINITSPGSELSHLFYVSLNNIANSASIDVGPFINVVTTEAFGDWYWTSTNYPYSGNETKYYFDFAIGAQNASGLGIKQFAWPVRNGDVGPTTVPLPGCGWLATYTLA